MSLPIVFADEIVHAHMALAMNKLGKCRLRSAGFVYFDDGHWHVGKEKSTSLNLGPKPGDENILRGFLEEGLSGLQLHNALAYLAIKQTKQLTEEKPLVERLAELHDTLDELQKAVKNKKRKK